MQFHVACLTQETVLLGQMTKVGHLGMNNYMSANVKM